MGAARRRVLSKLLEKQSFSPANAVGGGMPPMDPAAMGGGMPPAQPPMDPAAMQGAMPPMDPSMGAGMAAAGGAPMVDPATGMPMDPTAMGVPGMGPGGPDPMMMPITELTVGDLIELIGQVVTEATGGGGEAAPKEPSEPKGESEGTKADENDIVDRLDQILALLSGADPNAAVAPATPMGPEAGAVAPEGPGPKLAESRKVGRVSIADMICEKVSSLR